MALAEIVAHKRREVEARRRARPLEEFRSSLRPSDRSLEENLLDESTGFVLECKRSSPSQGRIRDHFDPESIARAYAPFASAISVIADERFFEGHLDYLDRVRRVVEAPVLLKDFVVEPYQVYEGRAHGADAVLLMLSVLDDATFRLAFTAAEALGMDALVEVHDESELARALALGARIIGINNRNLADLTVDLSVTERLAGLVPNDRFVISESGIASHRDVLRLRSAVDGFLVGTSMMRRSDLDAACRELIFGRVKVCGLTRPEDARHAWQHGVSWGGMIFAEESPRAVSLEQARELREGAPLRWVGVFVNASVETVVRHAAELALGAVQLHGEESAATIAELRAQLPPECEIWQVQRVGEEGAGSSVDGADRVLLDTYRPDRRGGTGESFDWTLIGDRDRDRVVLSGGLSPSNIAAADREGCWALDVNSGVESSPGRKDPVKISTLAAQLRGVSERSPDR